MEATSTWLPTNAKFDENNVMKLPDTAMTSVSNSVVLTFRQWTATRSINELRKELELIREESPDLYEALAKDDPSLIK